ncbi:MAG: T9SS type A sorting domain-containing protein, partial [Ignavibacteriae bacterium]|nr:T9SS type A sorting domain-containing protein [Ignavibacteriota bacterium]
IKTLGSTKIDSLVFRGSWAIIGHKGAAPGDAIEKVLSPYDGQIFLDSTFISKNKEGFLETVQIGPSINWKTLAISDSLPNNSSISYKPILISQTDNSEDTLAALNMVNGEASLKNIDAKKNPYIKILAEFKAGDNNTSPSLKSLGVDYDGVPELATNYQVVSVEKDTVQQGEDAKLSFYVYNVGESAADSFKVTVDVVKPDNSKERIFEQMVDSIGSESRKKFSIPYNTSGFNGQRTFAISIDSDNKILELYEDNNFYNIPFYVLGDTSNPSLAVTFDGNELFDGEYVCKNPKIKIELNDPSLVPITDTSSVSLYLNNKYVNYFGNEKNITVNFSQSNPKVTVDYNPTLEDGEYTLRVFGKDESGNLSDSLGITKTFSVMSEAKLLDVYNYPNPFSADTYFTFKLTQIPDEIKIKVFTIAGRLIKEIELNRSQLNYDLNKIYWDGRDDDGDLIGNGVYLYKVIMDVAGKKQDVTQKLAVVR